MHKILLHTLFLISILTGCAPQGGDGGGGALTSTVILFGIIILAVFLIIKLTSNKRHQKVKRVKKSKDNNSN